MGNGTLHTSYATLSTSHLYFLGTDEPLGVCKPRKYKKQVGYSTVALQNYFIPRHRKFSG